MKFIIDAQLPLVLKYWLLSKGYDAIHTRDLLNQNLTDDVVIIEHSVIEQRIVIMRIKG